MIRIGIVDFDSSHSVEFVRRFNHAHPQEDQWVDGASVVAGCVLPSDIMDAEGVRKYADQCAQLGVELVDTPDALMGVVDAIMIESDDGRTHLDRARPFLEAGIPTFVDKPLSFSLDDARELIRLAEEKGTPLFSASSLRYAPEVVAVRNQHSDFGKVLGAQTYSPAKDQGTSPGLIYYGIHAIETLYALMGPGCQSVTCESGPYASVVVGEWADGRIGVVQGNKAGAHGFGFTAWCEKGVRTGPISAQYIYRELLKEVVEFFESGTTPVPMAETFEIIAFGRAALRSIADGGVKVRLEGLQ